MSDHFLKIFQNFDNFSDMFQDVENCHVVTLK